jgi:hypothetical protein
LSWLPWNINNPNPQFSKVNLTNLRLNNFKIIKAMGLKRLLRQGPLECHYLRTKFYENLQKKLKIIGGGHTDIQTDTQTDTMVNW